MAILKKINNVPNNIFHGKKVNFTSDVSPSDSIVIPTIIKMNVSRNTIAEVKSYFKPASQCRSHASRLEWMEHYGIGKGGESLEAEQK